MLMLWVEDAIISYDATQAHFLKICDTLTLHLNKQHNMWLSIFHVSIILISAPTP